MKFIKAFTLYTLFFTLVLVALICAVDPYEKLGVNVFNFKTKAVAQSRENKFRMLEDSNKDYEAFILGSSAAHRFNTNTLESLTGLKTFNYAIQHSTPEDYIAIVKHILSKSHPKLILIQIGFGELNSNFQTDNRLYNSSLAKYLQDNKVEKSLFSNDYFTLGAIRDTFRVMWVNLFGNAAHSVYTADGNYIKEKEVKGIIKISQSSYRNYSLSKKRIKLLLELVKLSQKYDFKLKFFTAVLSYKHLEKIFADNTLKNEHKLFLETLSKLNTSFYNFHTQKISNYDSTHYFRDSVHPNKNFSDLILKDLVRDKDLIIGEILSINR